MKKTLFICGLLLLICGKSGSTIIENPTYEAINSGTRKIVKIELNKHETRIHMHCPLGMAKFSPVRTFIREAGTDKKIPVTDIIGGEFGKTVRMSASGDSTVILIFPALDKKIKKIDYGEEFNVPPYKIMIYGIFLDKKKKNAFRAVPAEVETWIKKELRKAPVKEPLKTEINTDSFFNPDNSRIIGYIKGYDPRLDFETGIINIENTLTSESFPVIVKIRPSGQFDVSFPVAHPQCNSIRISPSVNGFTTYKTIPFYIEPGQVLGIILDWEEFLRVDRSKKYGYYETNGIEYRGPLSKENRELLQFELKSPDYGFLNYSMGNITRNIMPDEFLKKQYETLRENQTALKTGALSPKSAVLLEMKSLALFGLSMLNYVSLRNHYHSKEPNNAILKAPISENYYNFIQKMPFQNPFFLIADGYFSFMSALQHYEPISIALEKKRHFPLKSFAEYIEGIGIKLTKDEEELKTWVAPLDLSNHEKFDKMIQMEEKIRAFNKKHKKHMPQYVELYIETMPQIPKDKTFIDEWKIKDSILINELGMLPNLSYDAAKVRSLNFAFKHTNREESGRMLQAMKKDLSDPILISESERMFQKIHPSEDYTPTELPNGKATEILRKVIDTHKGKILFIYFGDIRYRSCVSEIEKHQETRNKYRNYPNLDFIFITPESTPRDKDIYNRFIKEQELSHTYQLTTSEYDELCQQFRFDVTNCIVIDAQGHLLKDNFRMDRFEEELDKILDKGKKETNADKK